MIDKVASKLETTDEETTTSAKYTVNDGLLYYRTDEYSPWRLCLPKTPYRLADRFDRIVYGTKGTTFLTQRSSYNQYQPTSALQQLGPTASQRKSTHFVPGQRTRLGNRPSVIDVLNDPCNGLSKTNGLLKTNGPRVLNNDFASTARSQGTLPMSSTKEAIRIETENTD
jgi:hypothetical protein